MRRLEAADTEGFRDAEAIMNAIKRIVATKELGLELLDISGASTAETIEKPLNRLMSRLRVLESFALARRLETENNEGYETEDPIKAYNRRRAQRAPTIKSRDS